MTEVVEQEGKELVSAELGSEAKLDLDVKGGKLILKVTYDGKQVDASAQVAANVDMFLDKLAAKIPGQVDDAVISLMKTALKALG